MNNDKLIYGMLGLTVGSVFGWFLAAYVVTSQNTGIMRMMGIRSESLLNGVANFSVMDAHFIEQMIPHHEDAITIAKLAQEEVTHQEIKTLSQNIITSQTDEINQMKSWYKDWYGRDLPSGNQVMDVHGMMSNTSGIHMGMMGNNGDLDTLRNASNFDKAFIEEMIPHHQMAVMMANMLKSGTTRVEMKQLSENIITTQTDEINQMRKWYGDWGY